MQYIFKLSNQATAPCSIASMKYGFFTVMALCVAIHTACENGSVRSFYQPVLPKLPPHWEEILGDAHWRLEWVGEDGSWREKHISDSRELPELSLIQEWTTPVLAWPFWPEWDLLPGMFRPCGALFPWDASGAKLKLGWKGGVDAFFWKELAAADYSIDTAKKRLPWYFDWPRFRELLYESGNVPEPVRSDPWLPDWKSIAQKTVQSGFDRRRIVARSSTELAIPSLSGRWIGSSPFAAPIYAAPGAPLLLPATDVPDVWVSSLGVLKCSASGWVLRVK